MLSTKAKQPSVTSLTSLTHDPGGRKPSRTAQSTLQELCARATSLGNDISFRLVELLTEVRSHHPSLRTLANQYLEICRMIWFIETGLAQAQASSPSFSSPSSSPCSSPSSTQQHENDKTSPALRVFRADTVRGLELHLRQIVSDFDSLSDVLQTYLDLENKGKLAIISSTVRRTLADRSLERLRDGFARSMDALRAAALVFQWSLGKSLGENAIGMGYGGVVSALKNGDAKRPGLGKRAMTVCVASVMESNLGDTAVHRCATMNERMKSTASDGEVDFREDMPTELCRRASFSMAMRPCE